MAGSELGLRLRRSDHLGVPREPIICPYLAQIASQAKNEREHGQYARKAVFQPSGRQRRSYDLSTRLPQKSVIELRDLEKAHQMA